MSNVNMCQECSYWCETINGLCPRCKGLHDKIAALEAEVERLKDDFFGIQEELISARMDREKWFNEVSIVAKDRDQSLARAETAEALLEDCKAGYRTAMATLEDEQKRRELWEKEAIEWSWKHGVLSIDRDHWKAKAERYAGAIAYAQEWNSREHIEACTFCYLPKEMGHKKGCIKAEIERGNE